MQQMSKPVIHKKKPKKKIVKLYVRHPRFSRVVDIFENDETATFVPGSPGYRVARDRSGLGYLETQAESAHIQGLMISSLFTGKFFQTTDPIVLFGMFLIGIVLGLIPLVLILGEFFLANEMAAIFTFIYGLPNIAWGISILVSVLFSIKNWNAK